MSLDPRDSTGEGGGGGDSNAEEDRTMDVLELADGAGSHSGHHPRSSLLWIAGLAAAFEALTCLARFGWHLQSTRDTARLGRVTFGVRIHHGYVGILLLLWARRRRRPRGGPRPPPSAVELWSCRVGGALLVSDLAHHFLVLWPATGSPQFDLVYPKSYDEKY